MCSACTDGEGPPWETASSMVTVSRSGLRVSGADQDLRIGYCTCCQKRSMRWRPGQPADRVRWRPCAIQRGSVAAIQCRLFKGPSQKSRCLSRSAQSSGGPAEAGPDERGNPGDVRLNRTDVLNNLYSSCISERGSKRSGWTKLARYARCCCFAVDAFICP